MLRGVGRVLFVVWCLLAIVCSLFVLDLELFAIRCYSVAVGWYVVLSFFCLLMLDVCCLLMVVHNVKHIACCLLWVVVG